MKWFVCDTWYSVPGTDPAKSVLCQVHTMKAGFVKAEQTFEGLLGITFYQVLQKRN